MSVPSSDNVLHTGSILIVAETLQERYLIESVVLAKGMIPVFASTMPVVRNLVRGAAECSFQCTLVAENVVGKSGLECAAWLFQHDPNTSCILLADVLEPAMLVKAIRLGICDVLSRPFKEEELSVAIDRALYLSRSKRASFHVTMQARHATQIHRRMVTSRDYLPKNSEFMPNFDKRLETVFFPALEAGGDLGNTYTLDDHRFLIIAGDVSGHDVSAGFVSTYFMGLFRGMLKKGAQPEEILLTVQDYLLKRWNEARESRDIITSIGVCCLLMDFEKMLIHCSCNGFPLPILCSDSLEITKLGKASPPLGWFDKPLAPTLVYALPKSGCIVLFTDGLMDLGSTNNPCMLALADEVLGLTPEEAAFASIMDMQRDDIFVQRFAWADKSCHEALMRPLYSGTCEYDKNDDIDECEARWESVLRRSLPGLSQSRRIEILLCCREASLNAMEHGCCGRARRSCTLTMVFINHGILRVDVRVNDSEIQERTRINKPEGHIPFGMKIIRGYADSLSYDERKNVLVMDFILNSPYDRPHDDSVMDKMTIEQESASNLP